MERPWDTLAERAERGAHHGPLTAPRPTSATGDQPASGPVGAADASALFDSTAAVDRALVRLSAAGLPRDLIEVVVVPPAAERDDDGTVHGPGRVISILILE